MKGGRCASWSAVILLSRINDTRMRDAIESSALKAKALERTHHTFEI